MNSRFSRVVILVSSGAALVFGAEPPRTKRPLIDPKMFAAKDARPQGTLKIGLATENPKFNDFGMYLRRAMNRVQLSWDKVVQDSKPSMPTRSHVEVRIVILPSGELKGPPEITSHASKAATDAVGVAIRNATPFVEWTKDMRAELNSAGEGVRLFFYYD